MANLVGSADVVVVDAFIVVVTVILVVVAFMLTDVVPLIDGVAAVVVRLEMTFGWLLSEAIVTILATHMAMKITSQMIIL